MTEQKHSITKPGGDTSMSTTPRAGSPELVFANKFIDSDDEEDGEEEEKNEDFSERKRRSPNERVQSDLSDELDDIAAVENEARTQNQNETYSEKPAEESETDNTLYSSSPRANTPTSQPAMRQLSECNADGGTAGGGIAQQRPKKGDSKEETFDSGWNLNEEDLICLPLVLNKKRIEEYKDEKSASMQKPYSDKGPKSKAMRLLKRRAGKGSSRIVYTSPLSMFANIAKQKGYDLPTLLETSEFMYGPSYQLPCMQCYEKLGGKGGTVMNSFMGATTAETGSSNGRCSSCGGQVQTLATYGKMIRQMRETIEAKNLVPYDVYPDGNCLFAAIVDQLRVRGDFSFTTHSLRQSAVNYLRKNPTADDGTPLQMFLTDEESWESYLARMSEDGEWGDHMILSALVNVIDMHIVIYGGMSGQRETILSPKRLRQMSPDSDEALIEEEGVIYLGHVGESHYMSLRPKQWRQSLQEGLQKKRSDLKPSPPKEDNRMMCPLQHINFILRQVFRMDFVKSSCSEFVDTMVPSYSESRGVVYELFGSIICKMVPSKVKLESFGPDISMFFPSVTEETSAKCFQTPAVVVVNTPCDTEVLPKFDASKSVDLLAEDDSDVIGHVLLIPKKPKLWKQQTTSLDGNKTCLKIFEVDLGDFAQVLPEKDRENFFDMYSVLGFKCTWPDVAGEWTQRFRDSAFPNEQTIQTVVTGGCHVIPITSNSKMADVLDDPVHYVTSLDDHTWCYSFVAAEKEICRFLSSEQRQCFLIFRAFVDITLKDIPIPSSVAKSIFFYACERIDMPSWKSKPGECVLILLKKVSECFRNRNVPHYFMRDKDLLQLIPEEALAECSTRLDSARLQPVVTLYFLLDQLNVVSSEMGSFVEEVIESINLKGESSAKVGSNQTFLPACTELLKNLIYQGDNRGAMLVFQDIVEESGGSLNKDGSVVLKRLMWDMHIGYQWCFALYVDILQQTTLAAQLCVGYEKVHVTEVFGPDCVKELPDTVVPECFSIQTGDLHFLREVSQILSQSVSNKIYIGCMKFYLKQYAELAGDALVLPCTSYEPTCATTGKDNTKYAPADRSYTLWILHNIYVSFFNFCNQNYQPGEFREMMPKFEAIAEKHETRTTLKNLRNMWETLGEHQKSSDVSKKMDSSKGQYVLATYVGDCFGDYGVD